MARTLHISCDTKKCSAAGTAADIKPTPILDGWSFARITVVEQTGEGTHAAVEVKDWCPACTAEKLK